MNIERTTPILRPSSGVQFVFYKINCMRVINIHKSVIHFVGEKNSWRTNIESILSTENKKIF